MPKATLTVVHSSGASGIPNLIDVGQRIELVVGHAPQSQRKYLIEFTPANGLIIEALDDETDRVLAVSASGIGSGLHIFQVEP